MLKLIQKYNAIIITIIIATNYLLLIIITNNCNYYYCYSSLFKFCKVKHLPFVY